MKAPALYLDQYSFSMWVSLNGLGGSTSERDWHSLIAAVLQGDEKSTLEGIGDHETNEEALHRAFITSSIWHEKRHFFDLCLSNYGAYLFRQFAMVARNTDILLASFFRQKTKLLVPITVYNDPVDRRIHNIHKFPTETLKLAKFLMAREAAEDDVARTTAAGDLLELGGRAQLEGLAYLAQLRCIYRKISENCEERIRLKYFPRGEAGRIYTWFELVAYNLYPGLFRFRDASLERGVVNFDLLHCLSLAAINGSYAQGTSRRTVEGATNPKDRFILLSQEISKSSASAQASYDETWEAVDRACRKTFGIGIIDGIAEDITYNKYIVEEFMREETFCPPEVSESARSLLRLRSELFEYVAESPIQRLSPDHFSDRLVDMVRPLAISVNAAGGQLSGLPEAGPVIFARETSDAKNPWVWAWAPDSWNVHCSRGSEADQSSLQKVSWGVRIKNLLRNCVVRGESISCKRNERNRPISLVRTGIISYEESDHRISEIQEKRGGEIGRSIWIPVIGVRVPLYKLIAFGRSGQRMLEPELFVAEQYIKNLGLEFDFVPIYKFPDESHRTRDARILKGTESVVCDITGRTVRCEDSIVIWPWTVRNDSAILEIISKAFGQQAEPILELDWSPWVISRDLLQTGISQ